MTAFHGNTSQTQHDKSTEQQVRQLQHAIKDNTLKLEQVQQRRLRAEEMIIQCTRETEQRVDLVMDKSGVVDVLQQLGHLLQEERNLSEQLKGDASMDRSGLQERSECVTNKVRSLTAEILEVKKSLAKAKTRNTAAQALIHQPTSKSKRNQSKPK